jgi:hypothetical protein
MKYLTILLVTLLASSCVTSGDLMRVESKVDSISADGIVTAEEADDLKATIASVAADVEARTSGTLEELAATGGITGLLTGLGLNYYRSRTRKRDLESLKES